MSRQARQSTDHAATVDGMPTKKASLTRRARVTCLFRGRLGNQMYQVATTLAHAWDHDLRPVFGRFNRQYVANPEHGGINRVVSEFPRLPRRPVVVLRPSAYTVREPRGRADPAALVDVPGQDRILDGLFSDETYYAHHRSRIVEMFAPSPSVRRHLTRSYGDLVTGTTVSVSIRRGDFLKQKVLRRLDDDLDWYRAALDRIPSVDRVLIFSDDPDWCREHAIFTDRTIVVPAVRPYDHLYLMGMCTHNIIPNSSFAWWGAWLAPARGRVVVLPEVWKVDGSPERVPPSGALADTGTPGPANAHTTDWVRM